MIRTPSLVHGTVSPLPPGVVGVVVVVVVVVVLVVGLVGELPPPPQAMPMDKQAESRLSRVLEVTATETTPARARFNSERCQNRPMASETYAPLTEADFEQSHPNSRKVYVEGAAGVRVPMREIQLSGGDAQYVLYYGISLFEICLGAIYLGEPTSGTAWYGKKIGKTVTAKSVRATDADGTVRYWGVPADCPIGILKDPMLQAKQQDPCIALRTKLRSELVMAVGETVATQTKFSDSDVAVIIFKPKQWDGKAKYF